MYIYFIEPFFSILCKFLGFFSQSQPDLFYVFQQFQPLTVMNVCESCQWYLLCIVGCLDVH